MKKIILFLFTGLLLLSSCAEEEKYVDIELEDVILRFQPDLMVDEGDLVDNQKATLKSAKNDFSSFEHLVTRQFELSGYKTEKPLNEILYKVATPETKILLKEGIYNFDAISCGELYSGVGWQHFCGDSLAYTFDIDSVVVDPESRDKIIVEAKPVCGLVMCKSDVEGNYIVSINQGNKNASNSAQLTKVYDDGGNFLYAYKYIRFDEYNDISLKIPGYGLPIDLSSAQNNKQYKIVVKNSSFYFDVPTFEDGTLN